MTSTPDHLVIIGAGPAGLALARGYAGSSLVLEAGDEVGGLCRSIEFGGGVFDIGGHSFHSPHMDVLDLVDRVMKGRWHSQKRDARVSFKGSLIDYPFQQHFTQIPDPGIVTACQTDLCDRTSLAKPDNFEDWILHRFGSGISEHFMLPYNRKLWARDLRRMSCEWVSERIAGSASETPDTTAPKRSPLQSDSQIGYPAHGGFGEIFKAMAPACGPIEFGQAVVEIDPDTRQARTANGRTWHWRHLASTMPLPDLVRMVRGCPADLITAADRLEYVSLKIQMILVSDSLKQAPQRVYVADKHVPPHKIAFNHTSSASLRSRPVHAIMGEIAYSADKPLLPDAALDAATADWLVDSGLVASRGDIAESRLLDVKYGYPVYTHERADIVAQIRAFLAPLGIHTLGRFGGWDYINSDACLWQGQKLAMELR